MSRDAGSASRGSRQRSGVVPVAALLLVAGIASGCLGPASAANLATSAATRAGGSTSEAMQAAAGIDALGLDLLAGGAYATGNVVFSPTSIAVALAMARAGARGETAAQMDTVTHSAALAGGGNGLNSLDQQLAGLNGTVKVLGEDQQLTLRVVNAPFAQRGYAFEPAYLDTLASKFGAGVRLVDFSGDRASAIKEIDGWVNDQTEKRIPELLTDLDPLTRLVLVNAIYLKAPWALPFQPAATHDQPFHRTEGSTVDVPAMTGEVTCRYAAGSGWKAADIPYAGGSLSMTIIVPDDLATFQKGLTVAGLSGIEAALAPDELMLTLPRFKTEKKADLSSVLSLLGMPLAFDPAKADFSGITTQEGLFISAVVHEATISVDEAGTEATAATAVVAVAVASGRPVTELHIDRPFIFAIRDARTGAILFLGRIVDPSL